MNNLKYRISLDLQETQAPVVLKAMRFDTKCSIIARLTSKFIPFPIGDGVKAIFVGYKPDGTSLFNDCTIVSDAIIYDFTTQTTTAVGVVECEFKLFDKNGKPLLTSPRFSLLVENTIFDEHVFVESTDEHNALLEFIIATTDDKLDETSEFPISNKVIATELKEIKEDLYNKVGFSGDYNELKNKPGIATSTSDGFMSAEDKVKVDSFDDHDHEISDVNGLQGALDGKSPKSHKHTASDMSGLADVSWSGSYNDLKDKPDIAATIVVDSELSAASENPVQNKVIVAELSKLSVTNSVMSSTGADLTLENTEEAKLRGLTIYGKTTQKGTTTPENPIPLESVGANGTVVTNVEGGNLIPYPYDETTKTTGGITFTVNNDGSLAVNGMANTEYNSAFYLSGNSMLSAGTYTLSGADSTVGFNATITLYYQNESGEYIYINAYGGDEKTFTLTASAQCGIYLQVFKGQTVPNATFKPMLNKGSTVLPYQPYQEPQQLITTVPNGLCGLPVSSGGNFTDSNGQRWICDEVDFERGVTKRRTGLVDLGTLDWILINGAFITQAEGLGYKYGINGICTKYIIANAVYIDKSLYMLNSYWGNNCIAIMDSSYTDAATFKAAMQGVKLLYELETPTETPLSAEEIEAYKKLHTNYPTTIISTEDSAEMKISYIVRGGMPSNTSLADLMDDEDHRLVSDEDIARWNNKSDFSGSYNDLADKPAIEFTEEDKFKLSGIQAGANLFTLEAADDFKLGGVVDIGATNTTIREGMVSVDDYGHKHSIENVDGLRAELDSKSTFSGNYNDLSNKPTIPSAYTLPTASATVKGGVIVGDGLSVDSNGVMSVSGAGGDMTWISRTQELPLSSGTILTIGVDNPNLTWYSYCFHILLRDQLGREITHTVLGFCVPGAVSDVNEPAVNKVKVRMASISAGLPQEAAVCAYPLGVQCTYNLSDASISKITATVHGWYKTL